MGSLSIPNLVPWLIFIAWIVTDQFCWITLYFNLTRRKWKEEKTGKGARRDDYSRDAIALNISVMGELIEGRLLFEEIRYARFMIWLVPYYDRPVNWLYYSKKTLLWLKKQVKTGREIAFLRSAPVSLRSIVNIMILRYFNFVWFWRKQQLRSVWW